MEGHATGGLAAIRGQSMNSDSLIYTIGTALNRAKDNQSRVDLLVEGMWVGGHVLAVDGFGVVLEADDDQHSVVRIESIAAVTVRSAAPFRSAIPERVHAMPGARPAV